MRDVNRIPRIAAKIAKLWEKNPDMRFGQLVDNIAQQDGWSGAGALFNVEDDSFEEIVDEIVEKGWKTVVCSL